MLSVSSIIGPSAVPSYHEVFNHCWTEAVARCLLRFRDAIVAGNQDARLHQSMLSTARAWGELGAQLGPPEEIVPPEALPLAAEGIAAQLREAVA